MAPFKQTSIRRKLTLVMMTTSGAILLFALATLLTIEIFTARSNLSTKVTAIAKIVAQNSQAALSFQDKADAHRILQSLAEEESLALVVLYSQDDRIFTTFSKTPISTDNLPKLPNKIGPHFTKNYLEVTHLVERNGEKIGTVYIRANLYQLNATIKRFGLVGAVIVLAAMLIALLMATFFQKALSKPILDLVDHVNKVSEKRDYSLRVPQQSNDEIGELIVAFNQMLTEIEARDTELAHYREELENEVLTRTEELVETNRALQTEIDERKTAEIRLERFRSVLDQAGDGVYIIDPDNRSLIDFNSAAYRELGYTRDEFTKMSLDEIGIFNAPQRKRGWRNLLREIRKSPRLFLKEDATYKRKSGSEFPVEMSLALKSFGNREFLLVVARDMTERQHAHEELETAYAETERQVQERTAELEKTNAQLKVERDRAEKATRVKSEFLANMSHEIRTPLHAIIGMADLLSTSDLSPSQRQYMNLIISSAESLMTILTDVLDLSKLEVGRLTLDSINFCLRDCIEDTINTLKVRAGDKRIDLNHHINEEVPDRLIGDPGRLRQIMTNLIGNAIKFTARGQVSLEVSLKERAGESVTVHFQVKDEGIGVPEGKIKSIFAPFVQADGSTTRKYGGTGLGLAISQRLANMLGGDLWAESKYGEGSTFHVTAQFTVSPELPSSNVDKDWSFLKNRRTFILDDQASELEILKKTVKRWGDLNPTLVHSRDDLVESIKDIHDQGGEPPLVIIDTKVSDNGSFQLIEEIQDTFAFSSNIRFVVMINSGTRGDVARCQELGVSAYLLKPITDMDLFATIRMIFQKEGQPTSPVTRHTLRETRKSLNILVAEDNKINQAVVSDLLNLRGHRVTVVSNGREVLTTLETNKEKFDLILMDVQMPEIGGLEAIKLIRYQEITSNTRMPIVALTAYASRDDKMKCLEAGADHYLSKPVRANTLYSVIEGQSDGEISRVIQLDSIDNYESFDRDELIEAMGGNKEILSKVIGIFVNHSSAALGEIKNAIEKQNSTLLERSAHSFKGAVAQFSARDAFTIAKQLETVAQEGNLEPASALFSKLEEEVARLQKGLTQFKTTIKS